MQNETAHSSDASGSAVNKPGAFTETAGEAHGVYTVECFDANGDLKWSDRFDNLVTTVGKNDLLDKYFAGSAYTAAWYVGLVNTGATYSAADTAASHAGWTELAAATAYSQSTRPALSMATAAASGSKTASAASVFSIIATNTVHGCFIQSANSGTTGVLYSAGAFTGGSRSVASGDTLNVTYTATIT